VCPALPDAVSEKSAVLALDGRVLDGSQSAFPAVPGVLCTPGADRSAERSCEAPAVAGAVAPSAVLRRPDAAAEPEESRVARMHSLAAVLLPPVAEQSVLEAPGAFAQAEPSQPVLAAAQPESLEAIAADAGLPHSRASPAVGPVGWPEALSGEWEPLRPEEVPARQASPLESVARRASEVQQARAAQPAACCQ
jgi:hypothetical protein